MGTLRMAIALGVVYAVALHAQVTVGGTTVPKEKFVVFLFVGHSNMNGRGTIDSYYTTAHPRAWNYRGGKWVAAVNPIIGTNYGGPTIPFLKAIAGQKGDYHFGAIHQSGSAITLYAPSFLNTDPSNDYRNKLNPRGELFTNLIAAAKAVKGKVTFGGIVCMMGWMESTYADSRKYADSFGRDIREMREAIRSELGHPDLPFLVTELEQPRRELWGPWDSTVRGALNGLSGDTRCGVVSSDNLTYRPKDGSTDHHYAPESHKVWAKRAVDLYLSRGWFPKGATALTVLPLNGTAVGFIASPATGRTIQGTRNVTGRKVLGIARCATQCTLQPGLVTTPGIQLPDR